MSALLGATCGFSPPTSAVVVAELGGGGIGIRDAREAIPGIVGEAGGIAEGILYGSAVSGIEISTLTSGT